MIFLRQEVAGETLGKEPVKSEHPCVEYPRGRKSGTTAGQTALRIEELDPANSHLFFFGLFHEMYGDGQRVSEQPHIWIEKQQIVGPAPQRALIACRRKSPVYSVSHNTER